MLILQPISASQYKDYIDISGRYRPFHSVAWLETTALIYASDIYYLGFFQERMLKGVIPVYRHKYGCLYLYGSPLPKHSIHFLGPVCDGSVTQNEVFQALTQWVNMQGIAFFQLCWDTPLPEYFPGSRIENRPTLAKDIYPDNELNWKSLKSRTRTSVRFALKSGVKLHITTQHDILRIYQSLLEETYRSQNITQNNPIELYKALFARRGELNLQVFKATIRDRVIAVHWVIRDREFCYSWDHAANKAGKELCANHLLHWHVIRRCHRQKLSLYDMGSTESRGEHRPGMTTFKTSFGLEEREGYNFYWMKPWAWTLLRLYRRRLRFQDRPRVKLWRKYFS